VRLTSIFRKLLGIDQAVLEEVTIEGQDVVVSVRLNARQRDRCGVCRRRCPRYDGGEGRRRWRALDFGCYRMFLEAWAPRVHCPRHGVRVQAVPWAGHDARFTRSFEDQVGWLAVQASREAVAELMRIDWRTVGGILVRVQRRLEGGRSRLRGLRRIGIDEISYRRGHKYLTVIVDHDTGCLVWAAPGRDEATLHRFFDQLGRRGCRIITHVSADAAPWISSVVSARCPNAVRCMDTFHVVAWASDAIDQVRRELWNQARRQSGKGAACQIKGSRWALLKAPENLTEAQRSQLTRIEKTNRSLYRAYLLKEQLREVFKCGNYQQALAALEQWLVTAFRSRLDPIIDLATRIADHVDPICATLQHRLTNARIESLNTRLRLLTRRAFGFHSHQPLVALAMLCHGHSTPALPRPTA
jgi:transposase